MAYNDYGAFVRRNGERMEAHEDVVLERLDGGSGGQAVFDHLAQGSGGDLYHAVLGDGEWRLGVYKTTFPYLWHYEDGRWYMADLLSCAVGKPRFACEDERFARMTGDKVTRPVDLFDWVRGLPEDGLEFAVPGGPTVTIKRGRDARWHGPTIHVSMTEADGTRWDAEAGDRYGADARCAPSSDTSGRSPRWAGGGSPDARGAVRSPPSNGLGRICSDVVPSPSAARNAACGWSCGFWRRWTTPRITSSTPRPPHGLRRI